jgi:rhomboid protease GluP
VLGELASSAKNAAIRKAAASRLAKAPGALLATLSLEDRSMLAIRRSQIPMAPLPGGSVAWRDQWVVLVLVAANIAVFVAQQVWGEEAVLLPGAFWPEGILQNGEWWRLITAAFLHAGLAHIGFNMTALLVLGPFLEKSVGHLKFAAIYFGSAIGSNAGILLLTATGVMNEELLVGASGAIFGVLGGEIVLIWQRWRAHREPAARQRLRSIALILALQVVFDLTSPQVSFSAHLFGFVSGIVLTALMFYRGFRVAPRTA